MPKPELEFMDVNQADWEPVWELKGLYRKVLASDPETGSWTGMTRFDPGTDTTPLGVQEHDF